jgi:hypothetical protein
MPQTRARAEELFWAKVIKTDTCWIWTAAKARGNYGSVHAMDRTYRAHRFAYELHYGPIPDGLEIDHLCHNRDQSCPGGPACLHRRCVNPAHLEAVTGRENVRRSATLAGINAAKTHCDRGHEFTPENTYLIKPSRSRRNGGRRCRTCLRATQSRFALRRRAAKAS